VIDLPKVPLARIRNGRLVQTCESVFETHEKLHTLGGGQAFYLLEQRVAVAATELTDPSFQSKKLPSYERRGAGSQKNFLSARIGAVGLPRAATDPIHSVAAPSGGDGGEALALMCHGKAEGVVTKEGGIRDGAFAEAAQQRDRRRRGRAWG